MYNTLNTNISNCTILALLKLKVCPDEIMEKIPSISIIDNDDFLNDTLTGGGQRIENRVHNEDVANIPGDENAN